MNAKRWQLALLLLAGAQMAYYYPRLPARVASHFGFNGLPDGWQTRAEFAWTYLLFLTLFTGLFTFIGGLLRVVPDSQINLPNRGYWLAPERRAATLARIERQFAGFGFATSLLMVAVFQTVIEANLAPVVRLDGRFGWLMGAYLFYVAVWTIGLLRQYALPRGRR